MTAGPSALRAWEAFQRAADARARDLHDPARAADVVEARAELERALLDVLGRVPYATRRVGDLRPGRDGGRVHLAVRGAAAIGTWSRAAGQSVCGAPPGRFTGDRPVTCGACLRLLDRQVDMELNPPELELF